MDWYSIGLKTAVSAYTNRASLQYWMKKACAYLDVGRTQIAITGLPSAGKSVLCGQMNGCARDLWYELPGESDTTEPSAITIGEWTKLVRVLPGQQAYRTHAELETFQFNPDLEGVIHVCDFGYSKPRSQAACDALIASGVDTLEKLRKLNLQKELLALNELLTDVRRNVLEGGNMKWLIIAVNKIDLFEATLRDALVHYHPDGVGPFAKALAEFHKTVGIANLPIYIMQTCANEAEFEWNGGVANSSLKARPKDQVLREFVQSLAAIAGA